MVTALIFYVLALVFLVATLVLGVLDGREYRSVTRAAIAALLCLACIWANWNIMYSTIRDNPTCETSTEVED